MFQFLASEPYPDVFQESDDWQWNWWIPLIFMFSFRAYQFVIWLNEPFAKFNCFSKKRRKQNNKTSSCCIHITAYSLLLIFSCGAVFTHIDSPITLIFDERYYVPDAITLMHFGIDKDRFLYANEIIERSSIEAKCAQERKMGLTNTENQWSLEMGSDFYYFPPHTNSSLGAHYSEVHFERFVYMPESKEHPPLGKMLIALGMFLTGGYVSSFTWRFGSGLFGILHVLSASLTTQIMIKAFINESQICKRTKISARTKKYGPLICGCCAGLLTTMDGVFISLSRIAMLDGFLGAFISLAWLGVMLDYSAALSSLKRGSSIGIHWWRIFAGINCGLALSCKLSALPTIAILGVITFLFSITIRTLQHKPISYTTFYCSGFVMFFQFIGFCLLAYMLTWSFWFSSESAFNRNKFGTNPIAVLKGFVDYHVWFFDFHISINAEHISRANPVYFPLQIEPSYFYANTVESVDSAFPIFLSPSHFLRFFKPSVHSRNKEGKMSIICQGNLATWWTGSLSIVILSVVFVFKRSIIFIASSAAFVGTWVFFIIASFSRDHVFNFYVIQLLPFLVSAIVFLCFYFYSIRSYRVVLCFVAMLCVSAILFLFEYPLWIGQHLSSNSFERRKLLWKTSLEDVIGKKRN